MANAESIVREELKLWEQDFERHLDACPMCDDEEQVYCAEGAMLRAAMGTTLIQLMKEAMPRMAAEGEREYGKKKGHAAQR